MTDRRIRAQHGGRLERLDALQALRTKSVDLPLNHVYIRLKPPFSSDTASTSSASSPRHQLRKRSLQVHIPKVHNASYR